MHGDSFQGQVCPNMKSEKKMPSNCPACPRLRVASPQVRDITRHSLFQIFSSDSPAGIARIQVLSEFWRQVPRAAEYNTTFQGFGLAHVNRSHVIYILYPLTVWPHHVAQVTTHMCPTPTLRSIVWTATWIRTSAGEVEKCQTSGPA